MNKMLERCEVSKKLIINVINNISYNKIIIEYYKKLAGEVFGGNRDIIVRKAEKIRDCNKFWEIDRYNLQKVKDFRRTNLCTDKFCSNCKKVKQAARMARYMPEIAKYSDKMFHLTLTAPVVSGEDLEDRIKLMSNSFRKLIQYISCKKKIRGIDFRRWGFKGAIRSLEITFRGDFFHPHFHVLLVLDGFHLSDKVFVNNYSYSYGEFKNSFSAEEILIQKIWYLLMNGLTVSKRNIDSLELGYSCKIDKLKADDYNDVFKYMMKEFQEDGELITYEQFKTLYFATYRVKQIQGYGVFYHISDDGDIESYIEEYEKIIDSLRQVEMPDRVFERPDELLNDKGYVIISRKSYFRYLREIGR